jgi:ABC-2 type transport system permease protein
MSTLTATTAFEARRMSRIFSPVFFALVFPVLMLGLFGGIYGNEPSPSMDGMGTVDASVPAFIVMVVCVTGLMSFPLGVAEYRDKGILKRFRATPMPASTILAAQGVVNVVLTVAGVAILVIAGTAIFGLHGPDRLVVTILAVILTGLAMFALGGIIAALAPTERSATAISMLVYFPMIFLSGATIPLQTFPEVMKNIAHVLPATYGVDLIQYTWLGAAGNVWLDVAVLGGLTVLAGAISVKWFRWE